jgi:hypothetical protein
MSTTNSDDLTALDGGRGSGGRLREPAGGCQATSGAALSAPRPAAR